MSQLPTAPDAQPMTTANAQPRIASCPQAVIAVPQLLPATDSRPMAAMDVFRQNAWTRPGPCLANDWADLAPEWHPDYQALGFVLDGLQTVHRVRFPVMHQYEAETYYHANGNIVFTLSKGLPSIGLQRKAIKGDARCRRPSTNGTDEIAESYNVRPHRKK